MSTGVWRQQPGKRASTAGRSSLARVQRLEVAGFAASISASTRGCRAAQCSDDSHWRRQGLAEAVLAIACASVARTQTASCSLAQRQRRTSAAHALQEIGQPHEVQSRLSEKALVDRQGRHSLSRIVEAHGNGLWRPSLQTG